MPENWSNLDLDSHEITSRLADPLTAELFLLEIDANEKEITRETLRRHFEKRLRGIVDEAREIFRDNLDNLTDKAKRTRNQDKQPTPTTADQ